MTYVPLVKKRYKSGIQYEPGLEEYWRGWEHPEKVVKRKETKREVAQEFMKQNRKQLKEK